MAWAEDEPRLLTPVLNLCLTCAARKERLVAVIYTRGRSLKTAISGLFVVVAAASLLTVLVQLVIAAVGGSPLDPGWAVVAGVSTGLAVWATRSQGLLRLLSVADPSSHQGRARAVWVLLAVLVLLVVGLKTGSPDRDAYKNLVFGEGGLVEWSQVLVLLLATRAAWLIGSDLNERLEERQPGGEWRSGCTLYHRRATLARRQSPADCT